MVQGVADAGVASRGYVDVVAAVMEQGRSEVESFGTVVRPCLSDLGGVVGDDKLARGVYRVSTEIEGETVNALPR